MDTKKIRLQVYMSQKTFAETLGISISTVRSWEQGIKKPNITQLGKLVKFCKENNIEYQELIS